MLFFWTFYLSENPDVSLFPQKSYLVKSLVFSKLIRKNVSWASNQYIKMISESLADLKSALWSQKWITFKKYIKIETSPFK